MDPAKVTIVIPALNEALAIDGALRAVRQRLPEAEIIVVNDGSTDDTARIAREAGAQVIDHPRCRGYGASLATGTREASRDYVLYCDGDGQHSADDVAKLVDEVDGYDMVVGQRGQDSHVPLSRKPGKRILRWFADYLAGQKIPDLNSGLRIVRREVMLRYLHLMPEGFSYSTTSTFAMMKTGRMVKYVPIRVAARVGKSTVNQFRHGFGTLMLMLRLTVLFEPLKVFLAVSGWMLAISVLSFMFDVWRLVSRDSAGLSDSTVLLSIATLIIFMFGLLCDQVSAIRRDRCL